MDWLVEVTSIEKGRKNRANAHVYFSQFFNASTEDEARKIAKELALKYCRHRFPNYKKFSAWKYRNHGNVQVLNKASMFLRQKGNTAEQIELYKVEIVGKRPSGATEYRKLVEFD